MTCKLSKIQVSPHDSVGKTKQSLIVGQFFFLSEELPSDIQGGHLEYVLMIYQPTRLVCQCKVSRMSQCSGSAMSGVTWAYSATCSSSQGTQGCPWWCSGDQRFLRHKQELVTCQAGALTFVLSLWPFVGHFYLTPFPFGINNYPW